MKASVASIFTQYQTLFEGKCSWLYLDVKGLVTTAIGLLVDPLPLALQLPWQINGYAATQQEIIQAWNTVKNRSDMKMMGGGAYVSLTSIRLTDAGINTATLQKAMSMETYLRQGFPSYDNVPADAQLGLFSIAWACGPSFGPSWPLFSAAFNNGDFIACSTQCSISAMGNPGVVPRNAATMKLFRAAANAVSNPSVYDPNLVNGWP